MADNGFKEKMGDRYYKSKWLEKLSFGNNISIDYSRERWDNYFMKGDSVVFEKE